MACPIHDFTISPRHRVDGRDKRGHDAVRGCLVNLESEPCHDSEAFAVLLTRRLRNQFHPQAPSGSEGKTMATYRVREVKFLETEGGHVKLKPLREYEREASDAASVIAEVSRFFEMELSSPKALDVVDFDEVIILDEKGAVIARFGVADFWEQEWNAVAAKAGSETVDRLSR
jgi:hypothetical protein